jgi:hypothetical protein
VRSTTLILDLALLAVATLLVALLVGSRSAATDPLPPGWESRLSAIEARAERLEAVSRRLDALVEAASPAGGGPEPGGAPAGSDGRIEEPQEGGSTGPGSAGPPR